MKIEPSAGGFKTTRIKSEPDQQAQSTDKTAASAARDSFVESASDKASLFSHPQTDKLQSGSGVVSGLQVSNGTGASDSIKLTPGSAVTPAGKLVELNGNEFAAGVSSRPSFFYGKKLDAGDLSKDQDYKRNTHGRPFTIADLTMRYDYSNAGKNPPTVGHGLLSAASRIAAELALFNPAMVRLSELTGKSAVEIQALLNKYGVDPGNLPVPPNQNVAAFVQDPAFSAYTQQDLLKALYGR